VPEASHRDPDPGASVQPPESPYNEAEGKHGLIGDEERRRLSEDRRRIRDAHQVPRDDRPPSSARGVHHVALVCADVERTTRFYQGLLGFPLTAMFENRDLAGSTHFFFDIGNGNCLAFFDLPGVDPGPYEEVLGGLHHLAISMPLDRWQAAKDALDGAGIEYDHVHEVSLYFRGPDGERLELIADPLGWMYGERVD
jgi:catechol 2,3-dioxygenase-like lactoylglutathione lyase family enzyme